MNPRSLLIALFLGSQALLPLHYYVGQEDTYDAYDERFAWRMFSPIRMLRCKADYRVGGQPRPLMQNYHATWNTLSERGRIDVLERLAEDLCAKNEGEEVTLNLSCKEADGTVKILEKGERNLCEGEGLR